jgi:predicted nucleic acid-binding protein
MYLDTSALVKLYVEEEGSAAVAAALDEAEAACTVRVSYAEARAAFARHRREGALSATDLRRVVRALDEDWSAYQVVDVSDGLVRRAGALSERHALRAFDALQLAAALELRRGGVSPEFACFDARLIRAARRERLTSVL